MLDVYDEYFQILPKCWTKRSIFKIYMLPVALSSQLTGIIDPKLSKDILITN